MVAGTLIALKYAMLLCSTDAPIMLKHLQTTLALCTTLTSSSRSNNLAAQLPNLPPH